MVLEIVETLVFPGVGTPLDRAAPARLRDMGRHEVLARLLELAVPVAAASSPAAILDRVLPARRWHHRFCPDALVFLVRGEGLDRGEHA